MSTSSANAHLLPSQPSPQDPDNDKGVDSTSLRPCTNTKYESGDLATKPQAEHIETVETVTTPYFIRQQVNHIVSGMPGRNKYGLIRCQQADVDGRIEREANEARTKKKSWKAMDMSRKWTMVQSYLSSIQTLGSLKPLSEKTIDRVMCALQCDKLNNIEYDSKLGALVKLNFRGM